MSDAAFWELESGLSTPLVVRREYVLIGGDLEVGALLSQIAYWHRPGKSGKSKLKVQRDGEYWVAKTREEWMDECVLSRRQYTRAVSVLQEKGLIVMKMMKFAGRTISHIRLLLDRLADALKALASGVVTEGAGTKGVSLSAPNVPTVEGSWHQTCQPYTEITISTNTTESKNSNEPASLIVAMKTEAVILNKTSGKSAEEILKNRAEAKSKLFGDSNSEKPLPMLWQSLVASQGGFQLPLTMKDRGQLKKFTQDAGEHARGALEWVVASWWKFSQAAKAEAGLANVPIKPQLGFLLTHRATAMNMYLQSIAKPEPVTAPKPKPVAVAVPVKTEDEKPYHPSLDDLNAVLESLKG